LGDFSENIFLKNMMRRQIIDPEPAGTAKDLQDWDEMLARRIFWVVLADSTIFRWHANNL